MSEFNLASPDLAAKELQDKYRAVFLQGLGREVLTDVLISLCHFGCYLTNEKEVTEHNLGVAILANCGVFKVGREKEIINALLV